MKRPAVPFMLLSALLFCAAAQASQSVEGRLFTARVPEEGWTVQSINDMTEALIASDRSIVMTVTKMPARGLTLHEAALQLSRVHGASGITKMEGAEEAYEYTGTVNGQRLYTQFFALPDAFGCISVIGDCESPVATRVFNSIAIK
ncbi:MAG: hypothetical protein ACOYD9_01090 [Pyramidobacter sp.]|jgi:hypothetical protein